MEAVMREEINNTEEKMPAKKKGIAGSTLKWIAIVTMFIDHAAATILTRMLIDRGYFDVAYSSDMNTIMTFMQENMALMWSMEIMRYIGRIAFPIFCFLLVEGFLHTSNVKKYAGRMLIFALISEIPLDLAIAGTPFYLGYQNVMFTLLIGIVMLWGFSFVEQKEWKKLWSILLHVVILVAAMGVAILLKTDYDWCGVLAIAGIYYLSKKGKKTRGALLGCAALIVANLMEIFALIAVPFIAMYNGERGRKMKYFFYAFYPAHLFFLWCVCALMGMGGINTLVP